MQGAGCRVQGAGCRVQGAGCRVQGAGCRVEGAPLADVSEPVVPLLLVHLGCNVEVSVCQFGCTSSERRDGPLGEFLNRELHG